MPPRRGLTLIELLTVMVIIAMIWAIMVVVVQKAQQSAREHRTLALVTNLDTHLMNRWQAYESRRVPITQMPGGGRGGAAERRLKTLRELMRLEFPDRWGDVTTAPATQGLARPAATVSYQRRYNDSKAPNGKPSREHGEAGTYQGAECLFLILTTRMGGEESAREHFNEGDLGDKDEDGLLEFHDGWRLPVEFLRWAPAFISDLQPREARANPDKPEWHDPFDVQMSDRRAFALYPLIFSAGADQEYGIRRKREGDANDPYGDTNTGKPEDQDSYRTGGRSETGYGTDADNIHNHLLRLR